MRIKNVQPEVVQGIEGFSNNTLMGFELKNKTSNQTNNYLLSQNKDTPPYNYSNPAYNTFSGGFTNNNQRKPIKSDEFFENLKQKLENPNYYLFNEENKFQPKTNDENKPKIHDFNNYINQEKENLKKSNLEMDLKRKEKNQDLKLNIQNYQENQQKIKNDFTPFNYNNNTSEKFNSKESVNMEEVMKKNTLGGKNLKSNNSFVGNLKANDITLVSNILVDLEGDEYNLKASKSKNNNMLINNSNIRSSEIIKEVNEVTKTSKEIDTEKSKKDYKQKLIDDEYEL